MADLLCPTCGRPNSDHREFCDFCGNPLDGALPAEPQDSSLRNDFIKEESSSEGQELPDEASRLDSLFSETETGPDQPTGETPPPERPASEESRLDEYLGAEDQPASRAENLRQSQPGDSEDDFSRLEDYFASEEGEETTPSGPDHSDLDDQSARLDDYFAPEEQPPEQESPQTLGEDESSRLNDFFADDPFQSEDPFQEPEFDLPEEGEQSEDEFDPFKLPPEELNLTDELQQSAAESAQDESPLETWDFLSGELDSVPEGTQEAESSQEAPDEFSFLDPPLEEKSEELPTSPASSPEEKSPGDQDGLESDPTAELSQQEAPIGETSPGEWEFLDASPPSAEPVGEHTQPETPTPESTEDEFDFLDPELTEEPPSEQAPQPASEESMAEEWDFLDPGLSGDPLAEVEGQAQAPSGEADTGEFDWLDPGPAPDQPAGEEVPEFEEGGFGEDSGWLDMLQSPPDRPAAREEIPDSDKPQTDWLEKIKRLNQSSDLVDEDSSFPDWLAVSEQAAAETEEPSPPQDSEESTSEVPDWLKVEDDDSLNEFLRKKDLTNEEYKPQIAETSGQEADREEEDQAAMELSDSEQIKFPSWADKEGRKGEQSRKAPVGDQPAAEPFQIEEEDIDDLFNEELPEWLTAASSGELGPMVEQDLAQGELPGWVEAMRPVVESDASSLEDDEDYIENYGPLAGIPSVLPAEAEIGIDLEEAAKKPLDLQASSSHQDYVNLLKRIIGDENKGKTIQRPAPLQTQRILRWLIAIFLLVITASTVVFGSVIETQPPTASQYLGTGYATLYELIESLSDGQPVLIAYDYQPAAAGELHTAAAGVVDHLMEQGTFLSFVSTQPTGPALAEHFLDTTQSEHNYLHTQKYINLGYLPGESAGLLSFTIAPKQIIPLAFDGSNAWDSPPLINVDGISDFKMILVITDDPNTAKIWIEQVASGLDNTPLTMVVSAQVEPLIQPYFRSSPRQLDGYVAGVIDSMNYEGLTGRPNLSTKIWLPFNMSIIISVGIIFISGLANGVLSLFSRRRAKLLGEEQ